MFIFDFTNFKPKEYFFIPIMATATAGIVFFHYLRVVNKNKECLWKKKDR